MEGIVLFWQRGRQAGCRSLHKPCSGPKGEAELGPCSPPGSEVDGGDSSWERVSVHISVIKKQHPWAICCLIACEALQGDGKCKEESSRRVCWGRGCWGARPPLTLSIRSPGKRPFPPTQHPCRLQPFCPWLPTRQPPSQCVSTWRI